MKTLTYYLLIIPLFFCTCMVAAEVGTVTPDVMSSEKPVLRWVGCGITKKAFMQELAKAYSRNFKVEFNLEGGGATKGIRDVAIGSTDMGGSCRHRLDHSKEERFVRFVPVAWDALVVMVHKDNNVKVISIAQLKDVYEGKITNWKNLGGKHAPIQVLVRRSEISGVGKTLRDLVWGDSDFKFNSYKEYPSSGPLEKAVEDNPYTIGVSGISSAQKRNVKLLMLNGKAPNYENIKNGDYMLYRPLYITYRVRDNPNLMEINRFLNFSHSKIGREIIRSQGVVPYLDALHLLSMQKTQWEHIRALRMGTNKGN